MDIDHILPRKFGGRNSEVNLQCICKHCNRSKQASIKDTPKDLLRSKSDQQIRNLYNNRYNGNIKEWQIELIEEEARRRGIS